MRKFAVPIALIVALIFTSGALEGQGTTISDYALSGFNGHFTVVGMTEAPANNDTFIIV